MGEQLSSLPATAVIGGLLAVNAAWDIRKREILLLPTLAVLGGGAAGNVVFVMKEGLDGGFLWVIGMLPGVFLLFLSLATAGKIGLGDGLAVCAAGVWCGAESVLFMLFFALLAVPAGALVLRLRKKSVKTLPFIPFLLFGFCMERMLFL